MIHSDITALAKDRAYALIHLDKTSIHQVKLCSDYFYLFGLISDYFCTAHFPGHMFGPHYYFLTGAPISFHVVFVLSWFT